MHRASIFGFLGLAAACATDNPSTVDQAAVANSLQNGSFEAGTAPWVLNLNGGAAATFAADCSTSGAPLADRWSERVDVSRLGLDGAWDVTLRQPGLALTQGQTVTVTFSAMARSARRIEVGVQQLVSPWSWYSIRQFDAPGDGAWHSYTWSYTQGGSDGNAGLNFDLGQASTAVWIDDVVVTANGGANLVRNGSFETATTSWNLVLNGGAAAALTNDCSTSPASGDRWSAKLHVTATGAEGAWDVNLRQSGVALAAGATISVSFRAMAKASRSLEAGVQQLVSPWSWYSIKQFSVPGDAAWHAYSWTYTQPASDSNAAFNYDVGQATGDVWIDNVVVTAQSGSTCTPTTCAAAGVTCGTISDGCGGTLDCGVCPAPQTMAAPPGWSYSQLVFETQFGYSGMGTAPSAPNQGSFVANGVPRPNTSVGFLNDWNFGNQEQPGAVWSRSGSFPYWGSSQAGQTGTYASGLGADYSFPGNVFQTSTGANPALFTGYTPQTFTAQGTGLTLHDHYVGGPQQVAIQSNGSVYYYKWSSGMINTEGKRFFPFGGATEFYGQVKAKMAGPNSGSWSGIWLLPDRGQSGTGQEIDIQEYNVSGANPYKMYAHVQGPAVLIGTGTSSTPLSAGYHVYGWDVNSATQTISVYLDGVRVGTFTGPQIGARYYLILDAAISSGNASWQQQEGFVPDSTADIAMGVAEIQIYQR